MTVSIEPSLAQTRARRQVRENLTQNRACGLIAEIVDLDWTFGRDGTLTARAANERWISGCSLPYRAATVQLRDLEVTGSVACFLAPAHAGAIRAALDRLRPEQAVIAIVPDDSQYNLMLHCEDFSRDRAAHRIHFVVGSDWSKQLRELFKRIPGLAIPTQFIRVNPASVDSMIADAQRVFSEVTSNRAEHIQSLRTRPRSTSASSKRLCVVGGSQRRVWNDWGAILADVVCDDDCVRVDPDDPSQSSPLAVARAASECDAIVTVDKSRADIAGIVPDDVAWVTWVTNGKVPSRVGCGARDRLLLLDEDDRSAATRSGWKESEFRIAKPQAGATLAIDPRETSEYAPFIAIVEDATDLAPAVSIDDFSSHRLLWELIADELTRNPFAIEDFDVDRYLTSRMRKLDIDERTLNRSTFTSSLIAPAYRAGLARVLREAGVPVREFEPQSRDLARHLAPAVALLHVWPDQRRVHAIDFAARAAIRPGRSGAEMVRRCRDALVNPQRASDASENVICTDLIRELCSSR